MFLLNLILNFWKECQVLSWFAQKVFLFLLFLLSGALLFDEKNLPKWWKSCPPNSFGKTTNRSSKHKMGFCRSIWRKRGRLLHRQAVSHEKNVFDQKHFFLSGVEIWTLIKNLYSKNFKTLLLSCGGQIFVFSWQVEKKFPYLIFQYLFQLRRSDACLVQSTYAFIKFRAQSLLYIYPQQFTPSREQGKTIPPYCSQYSYQGNSTT